MLLAALFLALAGCEPCPHYNRLQVASFYGPEKSIKKPYGTVRPFYTSDEVKEPYEAIGFMSCEGSVAEEGGILKAMLYRAADMGADGIILNPGKISQGDADKKSENINVKWGWMALIGNSSQCAFRAQAIRFTKATPRSGY
jgi:hypothetical protein